LFSSHILSEVEQVCTRIIIIAAGRMIAQGTPDDLRDRVSAESRLIAELRGPADEIRNAMQKLQGVREVDVVQSDGWCRVSIARTGAADVRESVAKVAADKGWGMRELRREVASLEDYFVKVVAQQGQR
jgi:ABC-2 type transport system ATP-binding protein